MKKRAIFTVEFWLDATDRAIRTAAQSLATTLGGDAFNLWEVNSKAVLGVALGSAAFSILTSIIAIPFGQGDAKGTASLVKTQ